ncbi:thioredoxin-dependent thiol peroxidase [Paenibacillus flagellatus]|uniref:thioredoxin-dependent peroxiredoxin n=1 Tax=Paenibacillus flagellatus TaxID=2211139 RepID=A0A2V5JZK0_9BACL|nr:thioredoxin-dependent thiol peroxidase [Paenibacillus flagellatus]PYI50633.1 thioredoxin-dependent thiol peroxidase [Paenibacillus flagellatus]
MASLIIGEPAPEFALPASTGKTISLRQFAGKKVVLFFYPEDDTPTCTAEACAFRDGIGRFRRHGVVVLGVSPDPVKKHLKFADKFELPYPLLSDEDLTVCRLYDVWKLKKLYGREYMGVQRSTFLIDRNGILVREWRNVRIKGHVEAVLDAAKELG